MNTSYPNNRYSTDEFQGLNAPNVVKFAQFAPKFQTHHSAAKAAPQLIHLWTLDELDALPDPQWLIDGILPEGGFAVLYGPPGSKKSFIALDWASSVATGLPWNGCKVKQGDVVYIYAEGKTALKQRNRAWQDSRQLKPDRLRFINQGIDISTPGKVNRLIASIHAGGIDPQLIIIDTLARNFGVGDENSVKDMNAFVTGVDTLRNEFDGCSVLVIHHTGKDPKRGARGSSALNGAEDVAIEVDSGAENKTGHITCKKQKDADPFGTIGFRLVQVGNSAVLDWSAAAAVGPKDDKPVLRTPLSDTAILKAIITFPNGAGYTELRTKSKVTDRTFAEAIKRLKDKGKLIYDEASKLYSAGPDRSAKPQ